jgi:quercetin dioxygenase-like cupin family protein
MVRGWFVGDFEPTLHRTGDVEIGIKHYKAGEREERHYHRVATEITVVISGEVRMGADTLGAGEIAILEPGTPTDFEALTPVTLVVAKLPGAKHDKYLCED